LSRPAKCLRPSELAEHDVEIPGSHVSADFVFVRVSPNAVAASDVVHLQAIDTPVAEYIDNRVADLGAASQKTYRKAKAASAMPVTEEFRKPSA
jgi:hypothetical protein